jgi:hypothetical protein
VQKRGRDHGKGNSRAYYVADHMIDARPQTGTAPDEQTAMRYPTRASELDHRRLQVLPSPLHDPSPNRLHAGARGERPVVPAVLDKGHQSKQALLSLASLITSQLDSKDPVHDNLRQPGVSGCEGGRRGATSTSGSDDPKGMRCRANGRSDTRRSDRSHGPRSSSGLSRGGEKRQ